MEALLVHVGLEPGVFVVRSSVEEEQDVLGAPILLDDELLLEVVHEQHHHLVVGGSEREAVEHLSIGAKGGDHAEPRVQRSVFP